jgi:ubiquinone/menaquinone biosynthesis C-methylase UbiE
MQRGLEPLMTIAARSRIGELRRQVRARVDRGERRREMTVEKVGLKAEERAMWALGDYHAFAKATVWGLGPVLVEACGVTAGQRVLDVAAGTGNVAIRAAETGAEVVASDLTPENFDAGRREAAAHGVELEWVEADAEALPFGDREFDVVTSSMGAIFAPDHQAVADELARVCRPGGTIGMINFIPEGTAAQFFELFGRYAPPPAPGALPPTAWGSEEHVRALFGDRVAALEMSRNQYVETAPSPRAYVDHFKATFGPAVAIYAGLADQPDRLATMDREFEEFAETSNRGAPGGRAEFPYRYLLVVARTREESGA